MDDFLGFVSTSVEFVSSGCTDASGTSIQGLRRRGLLYSSSTISAALGRSLGIWLQQMCSKWPLGR